MLIGNYEPRYQKEWEPDSSDGSGRAQIYTAFGVVSLFTFVGDERHGAFTSLETFWFGRVYHARLSRHYHQRWWKRLARTFSQACNAEASNV